MTFEKILVPIAPEQELNDSLQYALSLSNECSSQVTLISVINTLDEFKEIHQFSGSALDILDAATQFYHDSLKQHIQTLAEHYPKISFGSKIRIGIPFIEIIKEAKESNSSLIMIDSYRENKIEPCQRGSNTLNLMRKSEIPIWSLSKKPKAITNVIAALDLTNPSYQDFNSKIISLAVELCNKLGASLTCCHVWKLESEGFLKNWSGYADIDIALLSQKMRNERVERLNSLLTPFVNTLPIKVMLIEGEPREVLPEYVISNEIDLVILGSMSRTGISGFVMGNTAESMINQLECSVMTLKPDSFKPPV
ncbi:Universal stress protein family 1 [Vibrio cholerae]|nr:Universal stress protein family 1 [Vibrio cholerae]GHZ37405.1 Universal stress protein family 1 [Vibrio cholerae]